VDKSVPSCGDQPGAADATGLDPRALAERLLDRTRATVHYLLGADPDADDIAQQAMIEILRSAAGFRGESRLESWADRITVRTALRAVGRRRRRPLLGPPPEEELESPDGERALEPGQEQALRLGRLRRRLARHLGALPPPRRVAVLLRFVHGYSIEEIAALTEAPRNTVRDRLRVGKLELRRSFERDGWLRAELELDAGSLRTKGGDDG
jgi:RNA polymerase sigma-70 factor (ECF subfamily)